MMMIEPLRVRRFCFWLASFLWMGVIFWFSAQTAVESSESSDSFMSFLLTLFRVENVNEIMTNLPLHHLATFILRKGAHLFVFGVLGMLFCGAVCQYPAAPLQKFVLPMSLGILYACVDELHQYFVPGRACQIRDVCIDTIGVLLGVLFVLCIDAWIRRRKKRTSDN